MRVTRESVNNAKVLYRLSFDRSEVERAQEIYFLNPKLQQVMNNPTIPYEKKADIPKKTESLEEEVLRLRMENEYLKKLQALVQKRIFQENGKEQKS